MPRSLTDLRAANPTLGFAVYAYEPGAPVILEVHDGGETYQFRGVTIEDAIEAAFPSEDAKPEPDIFS